MRMNTRARASLCNWPPEGDIKLSSVLLCLALGPSMLLIRVSSLSAGRPSLVSRLFGSSRMKSAKPLLERAVNRASSSSIRST